MRFAVRPYRAAALDVGRDDLKVWCARLSDGVRPLNAPGMERLGAVSAGGTFGLLVLWVFAMWGGHSANYAPDKELFDTQAVGTLCGWNP